jgi:hypothetical protein
MSIDFVALERLANHFPGKATVLGKVGQAVAIQQQQDGTRVTDLAEPGKGAVAFAKTVDKGVWQPNPIGGGKLELRLASGSIRCLQDAFSNERIGGLVVRVGA